MGKRAYAAACQPPPQISQRPRTRRKKTPDDDDAASASASASGLPSSSTTSSWTGLWQQPKTAYDAAPGLSSCSAKSQAEQEPDAAPHRARTQAERRPRRGKKPNTARGLLRSCATATAQARLRHPSVSVSWGAKRSRTVRFGTALAGSSRWRDWAGLDDGPAGLIAERVLANDVADYVRFRAACLPWRRCCADPTARGVLEDPRLYPRHWIMLRDYYEEFATAAAPRRRRFLNTRTGQCVQVDVPELRDHTVLRATADGLLVLHCRTSKAVRLLNPLTRQTAELPPTTGLVDERTPCFAGLLDHGTVYLYYYGGSVGTMAIARPGDDHWTLLDSGPQLIRDTVFFAGRFYGVTTSAILVKVDMAEDGRGPCLVVTDEPPKPFRFRMMTDTVHLVDNGDGDLRLVHRTFCPIQGSVGLSGHACYQWMYRVYRVNFTTGKMTNRGRRNLEGRAIFIAFYGGLSVSPRVFLFLSADTIYLGLHFGERSAGGERIGAYHVRDGIIEPSSH